MRICDDASAVGHLMRGNLGIMGTDTVYCLVASVACVAAVERLYRLKERRAKPGPILAASIQQLLDLGAEAAHLAKAEAYWNEGPATSVETPFGEQLAYLHQGTGRQGVRVTKHARLRQMLEMTGPWLISSANPPALAPATDVQQARAYFGGRVDFYVDSGDLSSQRPSRIIRLLEGDSIEEIRAG
jgi:tRNA A37 threonylcarbamoyladenosine synthetase subunit TsaC/SUA5/YrdC